MFDILVLTNRDDLHADVLFSLANEGYRRADYGHIIRINTEDVPHNVQCHFRWNGYEYVYSITVLDSGFTTKNIGAVWNRRPARPMVPSEANNATREFIEAECGAIVDCLEDLTNRAFWLNSQYLNRRVTPKCNQVAYALRSGFQVPAHVIANIPGELRQFVNSYPDCVLKTLRARYDVDEKGGNRTFYTRPVSTAQLSASSDSVLASAPVFLQKRIHKAQELRVTVIGHKLFACKVITPDDLGEDVKLDWRVVEPNRIKFEYLEIESSLAACFFRYLGMCGLTFGAFDIIIDQEGQANFLEINPNGQFLWLEQMIGLPMIQTVFDTLIDGGVRSRLRR